MAEVDKLSGTTYSLLSKVSGVAVAGIGKINNILTSAVAWVNDYVLTLDGVDDYTLASTTTSDFQVVETDAWSVSFWVKPQWTTNMSGRQFLVSSSGAGGINDNHWGVYYYRVQNRMYIRWRSASGQKTENFWVFHTSPSQTVTGLGSSYWDSTNPGNVNNDGYCLITMTKGTGTQATSSNVKLYWNGSDCGNAYSTNGNGAGTIAMNAATARQFSVGARTWNPSGQSGAVDMDGVGFWTKELSQTEVTAIYNSGVPNDLTTHTAASDLKGYWNFEQNGDCEISSTNNLTLSNGATYDNYGTPQPSALSGLVGWFKADAGITLDTSGGSTTVSQWDNQASGQSWNMTQTTKSKQPPYDGTNFLLDFDGTTQMIFDNTKITPTNNWSVVFITDVDAMNFWVMLGGTSVQNYLRIGQYQTDSIHRFGGALMGWNPPVAQDFGFTPANLLNTDFNVIGFTQKANPTSELDLGYIANEHFYTGADCTHGNHYFTAPTSGYLHTLGGYAGGTNGVNQNIKEVLFFDRQIGATDAAAIKAYAESIVTLNVIA
jgi:hypothetical protein